MILVLEFKPLSHKDYMTTKKNTVNNFIHAKQRSFGFSKSKGFTLVETMVAITILLVAVVGPISIIGDALHKFYYARDEMSAINLAQEGIEVVRAVATTSMLNNEDITVKVMQGSAGAPPKSIWVVDVDSIYPTGKPDKMLLDCNPACITNYQDVYFDSTVGKYRQSKNSPPVWWTKTQFKRLVTTTEISPTREVKIESKVEWDTGGQHGTITVTENIFNWARP